MKVLRKYTSAIRRKKAKSRSSKLIDKPPTGIFSIDTLNAFAAMANTDATSKLRLVARVAVESGSFGSGIAQAREIVPLPMVWLLRHRSYLILGRDSPYRARPASSTAGSFNVRRDRADTQGASQIRAHRCRLRKIFVASVGGLVTSLCRRRGMNGGMNDETTSPMARYAPPRGRNPFRQRSQIG